jgi:hypothetical protein
MPFSSSCLLIADAGLLQFIIIVNLYPDRLVDALPVVFSLNFAAISKKSGEKRTTGA